MTSDDGRVAPFEYWQTRAREIVYLMQMEVRTLHDAAPKANDSVNAQMRALADELYEHAEELKSFLDQRRRL